jgi:hypothetical protein
MIREAQSKSKRSKKKKNMLPTKRKKTESIRLNEAAKRNHNASIENDAETTKLCLI